MLISLLILKIPVGKSPIKKTDKTPSNMKNKNLMLMLDLSTLIFLNIIGTPPSTAPKKKHLIIKG